MRKTPLVLFSLFLCFHTSPVSATLFNWDTTGVADTSKVSGIIQLTNNSVDNIIGGDASFTASPWSKNGKWIVYRDSSDAGGNICKINSDGTNKENLTATHSGTNERYVKVSPDSRWIAYFSYNALWVAQSDGTMAHNVSGSFLVDNPQHSWSPDSQWISYTKKGGGDRAIFIAKVYNPAEKTQLTSN